MNGEYIITPTAGKNLAIEPMSTTTITESISDIQEFFDLNMWRCVTAPDAFLLEDKQKKELTTILMFQGTPLATIPTLDDTVREDTITTLNNKFKYTKYKNKYKFDTINLPEVTKVEVYNDKVVKMTFTDGTFTKAIRTNDPDEQLVAGMAICYLKRMLDKDPKYSTNIFNKVMSKIMKIFKKKDKKNGK